jgi:hypothetical protein
MEKDILETVAVIRNEIRGIRGEDNEPGIGAHHSCGLGHPAGAVRLVPETVDADPFDDLRIDPG